MFLNLAMTMLPRNSSASAAAAAAETIPAVVALAAAKCIADRIVKLEERESTIAGTALPARAPIKTTDAGARPRRMS